MLRMEYVGIKNRDRLTPHISVLFRAVELCEMADRILPEDSDSDTGNDVGSWYSTDDTEDDDDDVHNFILNALALYENESSDADDEHETDSDISRSDSSSYHYGSSINIFVESGNEELDASSDLEFLPFP